MTSDELKQWAAAEALTHVENGMRLGLGTGSTAARFIDLLGARVRDGLDVLCVPTSEATYRQALALGIPLTTLDETPFLDLTVDGADELDENLRLIKGGGGALLREKIVATASDRMIVIADASKLVPVLGRYPLPVEVVQFGLQATRNLLAVQARHAGCDGDITLRRKPDGAPFVSDSGNFILDCAFGSIGDPETLDAALKLVPGVVENGLFLGIADLAIVAAAEGITVFEAEYEDAGA